MYTDSLGGDCEFGTPEETKTPNLSTHQSPFIPSFLDFFPWFSAIYNVKYIVLRCSMVGDWGFRRETRSTRRRQLGSYEDGVEVLKTKNGPVVIKPFYGKAPSPTGLTSSHLLSWVDTPYLQQYNGGVPPINLVGG